MFYKVIKDNEIVMIGQSSVAPEGGSEIAEAEYSAIMDIIKRRPENTDDVKWFLSVETGNYERKENEKVREQLTI